MASFFLSSYDVWPLRFEPGLEPAQLIPLTVIVATLLAHAAYTDLLQGRVIKNWVSLALLCIALSSVWLVFDNPGEHLLYALPAVALVVVGYVVGAFAAGDVKLWLALSLLLGPAAIFFLIISMLAIAVYSIPSAVKTWRSNRAAGVKMKRGKRLGTAPGAPGIALALPLTMLSFEAPLLWAVGVLCVMGAFFALCVLNQHLDDKLAAKEGVSGHELAEAFCAQHEFELEGAARQRLAAALREAYVDAKLSAGPAPESPEPAKEGSDQDESRA